MLSQIQLEQIRLNKTINTFLFALKKKLKFPHFFLIEALQRTPKCSYIDTYETYIRTTYAFISSCGYVYVLRPNSIQNSFSV